jgi:hypothetical protein
VTAPTRAALWDQLAKLAAIGGFLVLLAGGTWAIVSGAFGGVQLGYQVRSTQIAETVAELQSVVKQLKDQIAQMPRPSDYLAQGQHLDRIDGRLDELGSRMTRDEIGTAADHARIDRLEAGAPPIRLPR